jgi:hypothetical protein
MKPRLRLQAWVLWKSLSLLFVTIVYSFSGAAKAPDALVSRQGWLACPSQAEATGPGFVFIKDASTSCPQLAVAAARGLAPDSGNKSQPKPSRDKNQGPLWHLLSQSGLTRPYAEAELRWIAPSTLSGRSWVVLDSPLVALAPTRNSRVNWPVVTPGLAMAAGNDSALTDTVPSLQFKLWPNAMRPATTAAACFDSLAGVGVRGLVSGSSVPFGLCRFVKPGQTAGGEELCGSALTAGRAPNGAWDFAEFNCVTRPIWMVRSLGRPEPATLDFIDSLPGEPVAIAGADLNGDGGVEILIESRHHYPDGMLTQLRVAFDGKKGWCISQPLPLSDASGEGEGHANSVTWRLASKRMLWRLAPGSKRANTLAVCVEAIESASVPSSPSLKRAHVSPISAYFLHADGQWKEWTKKAQARNLCATSRPRR